MNEFVEFDYLDRKPITEAEDIYEKVFITIRDYLEKQVNTQHNLASEAARLTITQDISDLLKQNNLISKGE
jgi:arsenate reductase-like glutaredoxin family protein